MKTKTRQTCSKTLGFYLVSIVWYLFNSPGSNLVLFGIDNFIKPTANVYIYPIVFTCLNVYHLRNKILILELLSHLSVNRKKSAY